MRDNHAIKNILNRKIIENMSSAKLTKNEKRKTARGVDMLSQVDKKILVPEVGLEPTWSKAPGDFESPASTNFTTPAPIDIFAVWTVARLPAGVARQSTNPPRCSYLTHSRL